MNEKTTRVEEYAVSGDRLVATIKKWLHEGDIRRITIKDADEKTLIEVPLTLGVLGAVLLPTWAALGAIAALVADLRIVLERVDPGPRVADVAPVAGEAPMPRESATELIA
jgi:hypothetical protein